MPVFGCPTHGTAGVDEERDIEILLLLEELDEEPVETAIDIPIDGTQIVARRVISKVGEFQAGTDLPRAAFGAMRAPKELFREEVELFELGEESGIEKQRAGGFLSAGKLSGFCPVGNRVVNQSEHPSSVSALICMVEKVQSGA